MAGVDEVLKAARGLTEAERVRVVEELLATLPDGGVELSDDALEAELERRFVGFADDPSGAMSWDELRRRPD